MIAHPQQDNGASEPREPAATHLILVSIGNTRIALASWTQDHRSKARHFPLDDMDRAVEDLRAMWTDFPAEASRAVVAMSVNPPRLDAFRTACDTRQLGPILVVGDDLDLLLATDVLEPDKVGTDRLCAAAAAFDRMKAACVVADFGTAVTIDLIGDDGVFLGGTILPGMALCARALHEHTALLPLVDITPPAQVVGKDTESAIRSGIHAMMAGALREITERYATDIGKWPPLILTGGDAEVIAAACDFIDRVVPDLVLDGLVVAYLQDRDSQ